MVLPLIPLALGGAAAGGAYLKSKWDNLFNPAPTEPGAGFELNPIKIGVWVLLAFMAVKVLKMIKDLIQPPKRR